jgi:exodeoxyribonuclease V beta subunit
LNLNFSSKYLDIPTFIEEFESTSISVASNTLHGALIMTIHSSKGLEFKNIIIIDKLTKAKNDTDALLFDFNENLSVENIFYRISGRENFDERYKNLLQKRREASSKDRLNVLYVALTRAIEQMIIIKKKDKSIFDIIDMDITKEGTPTKIEKRVKEDIVDKREPISIGYYGEQNVRKERDSEDEDEKRDYNAIDFGLALHYTLEMMNNFQEDEIATAIESSRNHYGLIIEDKLWQDIESRVRRLVDNIEFQDMLKDSINIYKEKAISYNGQLKQMDLLIEHKESYIVIDYKSSKKFQEKHQKQVSYYCKAVNEITERDTKGIILYLLEDRVEIRRVIWR